MGPIGHGVISAAAGGAVWGVTGSPAAGSLVLGIGVLMDLDHCFDYYHWYIRRRDNKVYVLFHAWEYSIVGLALLVSWFYHPLLLAAVVAHATHVLTDHLHNRLSRFGYSIIYRAAKKFDRAQIVSPVERSHAVHASHPIFQTWRRMELRIETEVVEWFKRRGARVQRVDTPAYHADD